MNLSQRLLLGALLIVSVLVVVAVALSGARLQDQLGRLTTGQLTREARLISLQWRADAVADELADAAGEALGHRVTLVDQGGTVVGDSEFDGAALAALENHNARTEIVAARSSGSGSSERLSPSEGVREVYVAVARPDGRVARVSIGTAQLELIVARARRDVLISGLVALVIALALAVIFSRQVSAPVAELRDVASAIATGDLSRRPSLSAPGEVGELGAAIRTMADQLQARLHSLQAEEELLGALVESLNEGVLAVDSQRRVVRINGSGRELLAAHAPVPFSSTLLPRDRVLADALAEALAGREVHRAEAVIGGRTLALTARPLGVGGAVLAVFDLTGLRKLQAVRRDFVANVSHELKTPLTAIRGYAETLATELEGRTPGQHAQFAETIRANAERMQRLVDDLLDLSRIETGGWRPAPAPFDLAALISDVVAPYRSNAQLTGTRIVVEVAADAATLRADSMAVRQALVNLLDNAMRYTPGGGTVTVTAEREVDGGIALAVSDTGAGIAKEHLPRIFERFYRVDAARSRAGGGTGLGLAIVKHLVEAHGGRVEASSEPGQGTRISLHFPDRRLDRDLFVT